MKFLEGGNDDEENVKYLNSGVQSCIFLMPNNEIWRLSKATNLKEIFNEVFITTKLRAIDPRQARFFSFDNFWLTKCSNVQHILGLKLYNSFINAIDMCKIETVRRDAKRHRRGDTYMTDDENWEPFKSCSLTNKNTKIYISKSRKILKPVHPNYDSEFLLLNSLQQEYLKRSIELLHDNNIFHNDLHMNNVMLDSLKRPIIIDWGYAKIVPRFRQTKDLLIRDFERVGFRYSN